MKKYNLLQSSYFLLFVIGPLPNTDYVLIAHSVVQWNDSFINRSTVFITRSRVCTATF